MTQFNAPDGKQRQSMTKRLKSRYGCPVELSLEFVGGKWTTVILAWLKEAPHRYGELRTRMPELSDKVLTERLKKLESLQLIAKEPAGGGGHAYKLAERGESLRPLLTAMHDWGQTMAEELSIKV